MSRRKSQVSSLRDSQVAYLDDISLSGCKNLLEDIISQTGEYFMRQAKHLSSGNLTDQKISISLVQMAEEQNKHLRASVF